MKLILRSQKCDERPDFEKCAKLKGLSSENDIEGYLIEKSVLISKLICMTSVRGHFGCLDSRIFFSD